MTTVFRTRLTLSALAAASSLIAISSPVRAQSVCAVTGTTFLCSNGGAIGAGDATTIVVAPAEGISLLDLNTLTATASGTITSSIGSPAVNALSVGDFSLTADAAGPLNVAATGTGGGLLAVSSTGAATAVLGSVTTVNDFGASVTGATGASLTTGAINATAITTANILLPAPLPLAGAGASVHALTGDAVLITNGNVNVAGSSAVLGGAVAFADAGVARATVNGSVTVNGTNRAVGIAALGNTGAFLTVTGPTAVTSGPDGTGLAAITTTGTASVNCGAVTATGAGITGVFASGPVVALNCGNVLVNGVGSLGVEAEATTSLTANLGNVTANAANAAAVQLTNATGPITLTAGNIATTGLIATAGAPAVLVTGGTGAVSLTTGTVSTTGPNSAGVVASTTTGALRIATGNVTTTGFGSAGINGAATTGALTITAGNVSTAGGSSPGILAATTTGALAVTTGTVNVTGTPATGIVATSGTGNVTVTSGRVASTGAGVLARTTTGNQSITLAGAQTTDNAVDAQASGSGNITINATAPVTSSNGIGIRTAGTTGTITVNSVGGSGILGGISAINTGAGTVNVNVTGGTLSSTNGDAIHVETLGTANVNVASGAGVLAGAVFDAIDVRGAVANVVTINGSAQIPSAVFGATISATGGAATVNIGATGSVIGSLRLTGSNDTVNNSGSLTLRLSSDFGAGTDTLNNRGTLTLDAATSVGGLEVLNNTGTINALALAFGTGTPAAIGLNGTTLNNSGQFVATGGTTTVSGLAAFNNSGTIVLADGATNDTLTINGPYAGSGGARLTIDADGGLAATDRLVVNGNITGSTVIDVNLNGTTPSYNATGVVVVDGSGTVSANAFTLNPAQLQSGFLNLGLRQVGNDTLLTSSLDSSVTDLALIGSFGRDVWYQSFDAYHDSIMGRHAGSLLTGNGFGTWGQLYKSKDRYGDTGRTATIGGNSVAYSDQLRTDRRGAQVGIEFRGAGFVIGATGGYTWSRSEEQPSVAYLKAEGHNYGAFAHFGMASGLYAGVMVKRDRFHIDFANEPRGIAFRTEGRSTGVDGEIGLKSGMSGVVIDLNAGLSYVDTDLSQWNQYGLNFNFGNNNKSARGRLGGRVIFPSAMGAFIGAKVLHEFKDDGYLGINGAAGNVANIDYANRGTWVRVEGGLGANGNNGIKVTAWGDLGRTKSFGGRVGFAF